MTGEAYQTRVLLGDSRELLATLADNSVDSCVSDPPYELGFMGRAWDKSGIANDVGLWREVYRVLKPGAHLAAFGGTRTYHRLACAIEDAGFEIRDQLAWAYGSGFPKSTDFAKDGEASKEAGGRVVFAAFNDHAQADGWGTALKPSWEPICLARKPLSEKSIAANVLKWGTGALNIDGCRIVTDETITATRNVALGSSSGGVFGAADKPGVYEQQPGGRWPANLCHDGSDEVVAGFPETESGSRKAGEHRYIGRDVYQRRGFFGPMPALEGDSGSASRFFYCAKAGKLDRLGSTHPTVKPVALMRWLCRLITPPGGLILDPFAGSGSTGVAAFVEGFTSCLMELRPEAVADINRRLDHIRGLGRTTLLEMAALDAEGHAKARGDDLPLFGAAL